MIRVHNFKKTHEFVLDSEKELPKEEQTVFILREMSDAYLTKANLVTIQMAAYFELQDRVNEKGKKIKAKTIKEVEELLGCPFEPIETTYSKMDSVIAKHLCGWRNVKDNYGNEANFSKCREIMGGEPVEILQGPDKGYLFSQLVKISKLTEFESKNSKPQYTGKKQKKS